MAKFPVVLPLPESLATKTHPSQTCLPADQAEENFSKHLWLALAFPQLGLDIHLDGQHDIAAVLVAARKGSSLVRSVSTLARSQGVKVDMPVNAAYVLSPGLKVYPFDEQVEHDRLRQLAVWAEQFTSKVSLQDPPALLLEVRGSVRLFGGLSKLLQHIERQLHGQWRHQFLTATTPAPMASLLLARSGHGGVITRKSALRSALGELSVNHLPVGIKKKRQLRHIGIRVLRDLFRLPKEALARRFGTDLTHYLDRLLGCVPDSLDFFTASERFEAFYEFPREVRKTGRLLTIVGQLLEQLALFLRRRDICINRYELSLQHGRQPSTTIIVGMRQASRDAQHFLSLLKIQLERLRLTSPVISVTLTVDDFLPFVLPDEILPGLFAESPTSPQEFNSTTSIDPLLEQLQIRLGHHAIMKLQSTSDHRPECAYVNGPNLQGGTPFVYKKFHKNFYKQLYKQRPLWLLPNPQQLDQKNSQPWLDGPVTLLNGPERIEAGWWAGKDIRRDYYHAVDNHGSRLWIFRTLTEKPQWFLHGIFS